MTQLLDDALTAFKAGSVAREEELVDLADILVREAEDRRLAGACVTLDLPEPVRAAQVLGDALALRRCVSNLIDNAIQYGLEARVSAVLRNQRVVVMIDDRGPGIRTEDRDTVMEPFVRLETSRNRRTGGAGLGLAIARGVAEAHGGHLTLGDAPGGGTRAIIELPVFQD